MLRAFMVLLTLVFLASLVAAEPVVMDDGDTGTAAMGQIYYASSAVRAYNDDNWWTNPNSGGPDGYYSWEFTDLQASTYDVYTTWCTDRNLSPYWQLANSATPFTIIDGGLVVRGWPDWDIIPEGGAATLATVAIDQSTNPAGYTYNGRVWYKIGSYEIADDTLSLIMTNYSSANGPVLADAVMIEYIPSVVVMDDADQGVTLSSGVWWGTENAGYQDSARNCSSQDSYAVFQFEDLPVGNYEVFVTWPDSDEPDPWSGAFRCQDAEVMVYDGTPEDDLVYWEDINQTQSPEGIAYDGRNWCSIGVVETTGDELAVALVNTEGSYLSVDAVLLQSTTEEADPLEIPPDPATTFPALTLPEPEVFNFGQLTLVDEVICGDPQETHTLYESSQGVSSVDEILGEDCRVLPSSGSGPCYFGYVLGGGCGLQAGNAYVLVVEYPEDVSRSMVVVNMGADTNLGFWTGASVGDCLVPLYVSSTGESLHYGLNGDFREAQQLFHLHDRFAGIMRPRWNDWAYYRNYTPANGFHVLISQYANEQDPLSAGAAVKRIALYQAPSLQTYTQPLAELPAGLPKRRLFWREEMSDLVIQSSPIDPGVDSDTDWYEYKARLHKFLGMNTFAKDLLEFGTNQGWDAAIYNGTNDDWYISSSEPGRWERILAMLAEGGYDLDVLPYYEYAGSTGNGTIALGKKKRSEPLNGETYYTNVWWSENLNIDVSDPDAVTDVEMLLEQTISAVADGNRPIPDNTTGSGNPLWGIGKWGYIDFGSNWQNVRICETWTQSRLWYADDPSPFTQVYWHSSNTGFSGDTIPQGTVQENTLNFLTQDQCFGVHWTRDTNATASPITPQARYLALRAPADMSECSEFAIIGYINGQGTELETLSVTAGSVDGYHLYYLFDDQPEYNSESVNVVGAWLRPRVSAIPIGFSDTTRARYSSDRSISPAVTRAQLSADSMLLADYWSWWFDQRKEFLQAVRDYLQQELGNDAFVIYTWDTSEPGTTHPDNPPNVVTDNEPAWDGLAEDTMTYFDAVRNELHLEAMLLPPYNWAPGVYEWEHSVPHGDPFNYQDEQGVMMEYVYNKLYTVAESEWLDTYRTESGLACIRHFSLNEHMLRNGDAAEDDITGYFCANMEVAGPYCMLPEARAVAYGNPYHFGYLSGESYNRWFPGYVREFNANFLALPALPMVTEDGAASDDEVIVRSIDTAQNGTWLAVVNVSIEDKEDVVITLPVSGTVTNAVTGQSVTVDNGTITLDLWPGQLRSFHID